MIRFVPMTQKEFQAVLECDVRELTKERVPRFKANLDSSRASGFIFQHQSHEPFRRKGYAKQAMLDLEKVARDIGMQQLTLHLSAHSQGARVPRARISLKP